MKTSLPGHGCRVTNAAVGEAFAACGGLRVPWLADETRKPQPGMLVTHHASRNPGRAFTLIEIMVVVAIFGIVLTMGVPSIYRVFNKESFPQVVNRVVEVCNNARAKAIMGGAPAEIVIRADGISGQGGSAHFPENVAIAQIQVNGIPYMPADLDAFGEVHARFYENGMCDDVTILLMSDQREQRKIKLEITTGLAEVEVVQ